MDKEFIVNLIVSQMGEEQAKNIKDQLLTISEKMGENDILILKRLGERGVCLIITNSKEAHIDFEAKPNTIELENILKDTDI